MIVQLHASFRRCAAWVLGAMLLVSVLAYLMQSSRGNRPGTHEYLVILLVPFTIFPVAVWFIFVPSRLEFSDSHITIKFALRPPHTLAWSDLQSHDVGQIVSVLQFAGAGPIQIFPHAYRPAEWGMLRNFLSSTYPDKKASGSADSRMFRRFR